MKVYVLYEEDDHSMLCDGLWGVFTTLDAAKKEAAQYGWSEDDWEESEEDDRHFWMIDMDTEKYSVFIQECFVCDTPVPPSKE